MYHKYPSTPHLPWSNSKSSDDITGFDTSLFNGKNVVVTEKMDGENTSMYRNHIHARSIDSRNHPSRNLVKGMHGTISYLIPEGWRVCGENMFAEHSILYSDLESYFLTFSVWTSDNNCLSWRKTVELADVIGLKTVPVLYEGLWNEGTIRKIKVDTDKSEGYVVRVADEFHYENFTSSIAKWVRPNHVQTDEHWTKKPIVQNKLKDS